MTTFQFDQCFNDKKLARDCTNQGKSVAWCFPNRLLDEADPEVLVDLMARPNPLVTFDRRMAKDHTTYVPELNPGMLVVSNGHANPKTMTRKEAARILAHFKAVFPAWHQVGWSNSIVEITPNSVEMWRVAAGKMVRMFFSEFTKSGWDAAFCQILEGNAASSAVDPVEQMAAPPHFASRPQLPAPPPPAPPQDASDQMP